MYMFCHVVLPTCFFFLIIRRPPRSTRTDTHFPYPALFRSRRELVGSMSVEDNLLLGGLRLYRAGKHGWKETIDEVYDLFPRLRERKAQQAGTLSGGERQMLAVGRALMAQPQLLMLDEPSLGQIGRAHV